MTLIVVGVGLALGQLLGFELSWFVRPMDVITALQLHLTIGGVGLAIIAGDLAARAFYTQSKALKIAEEEIAALRQAPHVVVAWAEDQQSDMVTGPQGVTVTINPSVEAGELPLAMNLCNIGDRLASEYEVALYIPQEFGQLIQVREENGDRYVGRPIRYNITERAEGYIYSFVINGDREFVLTPHGTPLKKQILKVDRNPKGPLEHFPSTSPMWGTWYKITVRVGGDWGSQPAQYLAARLLRQAV